MLRLGRQVLEDLLDRRVLARLLLFVPVGPVEDGGCDEGGGRGLRAGLGLGAAVGLIADLLPVALPATARCVAEVGLEDLADVHARRDSEGVDTKSVVEGQGG